ncbi:two-component response regulator ARR10-like [Apium graveolens]|uniref:two-component response regulator ARR10-like n=1 Tax=Apium graveolens TaxID=4045 RepID=UPI003D791E6C
MEMSSNQNNNAVLQSSSDKITNILLVDHDMDSLITIAGIMEKQYSYRVVTARTVDHALCSLHAQNIKLDLVVLEIHMPDMDGFTLQQQIYTQHQLPVVLMSSDKKAKDSWKPSENGAVTFLLKPLTYEEVIKFSLYAEQYKNRLDKGKFNESQSSGPKKERVKWTHDLHSKFVNAIQELGPESKIQFITSNQM